MSESPKQEGTGLQAIESVNRPEGNAVEIAIRQEPAAQVVEFRDNGCGIASWTEGAVTDNVQLTITQDGTDASGQVGGLIGGYLTLVVGSDTLIGEVTGRQIELYLRAGSDSRDRDLTCRYRTEGTLHGTLEGENAMEGTIEYGYFVVEQADDCGDIGTCVTIQSFSGSRRPR